MRKETKIFYFSNIPYNFLKQRPQQLYDEWKKNESFEVFYFEPPNFNILLRMILKKLVYSGDKNILTLSPPISFLISLFSCRIKILRYLGNILQKKSIFPNLINNNLKRFLNKESTNIAILSSPIWEPFINKPDFDIICYDYLDSVIVHSKEEGYEKKNHDLILKSDLIFTTAEKLKEDVFSISYKKDVLNVSNGVNLHFFQENKNLVVKNYKKGTKKVVGYVGAIFEWIDLDLIFESAKSLSNVIFILVGPINGENKKYLRKKPKNVFFVGQKPYNEVPAYINSFDVAIIPFKNDGDISESTDPIKVYEYFSLGKPVVSTYLRQLKRFDGNLLKIITNPNEFNKAINYFLNEDKEQYQNERKRIAYENSWSNKATLMLDAVKNKIK